MYDRLEKFIELFAGEEPVETMIGLAITLMPLYFFTPPMVSAILTESTRDFVLVTIVGWFVLIAGAYSLCKLVRIPDEDDGYGRLALWIISSVGFTPASVALSYLCWKSGDGNVVPIIMLIEAGILWGTWTSWKSYRSDE